VETILIPWCLQ